jgi:hypothetical protein
MGRLTFWTEYTSKGVFDIYESQFYCEVKEAARGVAQELPLLRVPFSPSRSSAATCSPTWRDGLFAMLSKTSCWECDNTRQFYCRTIMSNVLSGGVNLLASAL